MSGIPVQQPPPGSDQAITQGCLCPRMDNDDPAFERGTVVNSFCPLHGQWTFTTRKRPNPDGVKEGRPWRFQGQRHTHEHTHEVALGGSRMIDEFVGEPYIVNPRIVNPRCRASEGDGLCEAWATWRAEWSDRATFVCDAHRDDVRKWYEGDHKYDQNGLVWRPVV